MVSRDSLWLTQLLPDFPLRLSPSPLPGPSGARATAAAVESGPAALTCSVRGWGGAWMACPVGLPCWFGNRGRVGIYIHNTYVRIRMCIQHLRTYTVAFLPLPIAHCLYQTPSAAPPPTATARISEHSPVIVFIDITAPLLKDARSGRHIAVDDA